MEAAPSLYTEYQVAVIKGHCGMRETASIPVIWALFQTTKHFKDHRLNLDKRMKEWLAQNGVEIDHGVFFAKDTIDNIVKVRPSPGDGHSTPKAAKNGVRILACLPRTQQDIESICLKEQAADESRQNQTLAEALAN
jgi:hypothetical protein